MQPPFRVKIRHSKFRGGLLCQVLREPKDKRNTTHVSFDVDEDHYDKTFLVPDGKVLGGRDSDDPWENHEHTAIHCGTRHWSTVRDPHFNLPIGRRLRVTVRSGPIGDEYEGHVSGAIELWYKDLGA